MAVDPTLYQDTIASIGTPRDAAAVAITGKRSAVALLKGIAFMFGLPAGDGTAATKGNPRLLDDSFAAIGNPEDAPAADFGRQSAIAIAKGILVEAGFA